MPNRILKESICNSDSINSLSWFEEVLYYRLIVNCDDYGRYDGRIAIIKNKLFPLKDSLTARTVEAAVNNLVSAGLVALYQYEGKPFLYLPGWNDHQTIRAKKSKYPAPNDNLQSGATHLQASEIICKQMQADDFNGNQTQANVPVIQSKSKSYSITTTTDSKDNYIYNNGVDNGVVVVVHLLEQIKGQPLTGYECEKLKDLVDEYGAQWVEDALKTMGDAGKIKLSYAEGVLRNWKTEGRDHQNKGKKKDKASKSTTDYSAAYK